MSIDECPICLEELTSCIETDCGHLFCSECLMKWQDKEPNSPPFRCPSCRKNIPHVKTEFLSLSIQPENSRPNTGNYTNLSSEQSESSEQNEDCSQICCAISSVFGVLAISGIILLIACA